MEAPSTSNDKPLYKTQPAREPHCSFHNICFSNKMKVFLVLSTTFLLLFILLFFIMLAGSHIQVFIGNPTIAAFEVLSQSPSNTSSSTSSDAASVVQGAIATDNSTFFLNTDVLLYMDVKNPTPEWGTYYYEALTWNLFYEGMSIASGVLPPFSQGAHASEQARRIRLQGSNIVVPSVLAFTLQSNDTTLNLEASTSFYVHLKGSFLRFGFVTHCNLTFPHTTESYRRLPKTTSCLVADQDRGHY